MKISIPSLLNSLFILLPPALGFGTGRPPTGGLFPQQNVRNEDDVSAGHSSHPETQVMTQGEQIQGDDQHSTLPDKALNTSLPHAHIHPCPLTCEGNLRF